MIKRINDAIEGGFDIDDNSMESENEIHPIDCKYYTLDKFNDQKSMK